MPVRINRGTDLVRIIFAFGVVIVGFLVRYRSWRRRGREAVSHGKNPSPQSVENFKSGSIAQVKQNEE